MQPELWGSLLIPVLFFPATLAPLGTLSSGSCSAVRWRTAACAAVGRRPSVCPPHCSSPSPTPTAQVTAGPSTLIWVGFVIHDFSSCNTPTSSSRGGFPTSRAFGFGKTHLGLDLLAGGCEENPRGLALSSAGQGLCVWGGDVILLSPSRKTSQGLRVRPDFKAQHLLGAEHASLV